MLYYLFIFAGNLFCELFVAFDFGFHQKNELLSVIAVNGITYPAFTGLVYVLSITVGYTWLVLLSFEILVVLIEWQLLELVLKNHNRRVFDVAFGMNMMSFIIGSIFII